MSEDNAGYCPAYLEPQRVKGTSRDTLGKGDTALSKGLCTTRGSPVTLGCSPGGDADFTAAMSRVARVIQRDVL